MLILNKSFNKLVKSTNLIIVGSLVFSLTLWPYVPPSEADNIDLPYLPLPGQSADIIWNQVPSLDDLELTSLSALVVKLPQGEIIGALEPNLELPLASLTKLMTAVIVTENNLPPDKLIPVTKIDNSEMMAPYQKVGESISYLRVKDDTKVTVRNLLAASLVGSANNATAALARGTGMSTSDFIHRMNERAGILGATTAQFRDTTGLNGENTATVYDLAIIARYAWQNKLLRETSGKSEVRFTIADSGDHIIRNTNKLFTQKKSFYILASKTGYLEEAGYNLALQVKVRNQNYLIVLFNAPTIQDRINDVLNIVSWIEKRG